VMIGLGVYRIVFLHEQGTPPPEIVQATTTTAGFVGVVILLRAFASGAVALTGTEAIATGVPAFQPPEARNAARTLVAMACILAVLFVGITFVATHYAIYPQGPDIHVTTASGEVVPVYPPDTPKQTVIAQVARTVFGESFMFFAFQAFTALLLFLAANTSFAAFPRLAAVLAEDGFFPRHFAFRGDRLAFSMGIVMLGVIAGTLVLLAGGHTHALIPLYSVMKRIAS